MKTTVAVFFGCSSVEHEVSVISAVQAMKSLDKEKYDIIPVYVTKDGEMYTSPEFFDIEIFKNTEKLKREADAVYFLRENGKVVMRLKKQSVFKKTDKTVDVAFPIVHGTNCEDGTIQGYFEFLGLPYVGSNILASAVGMDKAVFKDVLKRSGLPVLDCITFTSREYAADREKTAAMLEEKIGFPLIIKPINLGSSVGITKVKDKASLYDAVDLAVSFADCILAERAITSLREVNCSVLGDRDECIASVIEEPFMNDEILSYKDKYLGGSKNSTADKTGGSKGMASLGRKIPAELSPEREKEIKDLSLRIFKTIGASGVVRIDFMIDTETDTVYANEVNTIPGSLAFYLWNASGISYTELLDRMISLAFRRQRQRENLTFTIDTNILSGVDFGGVKGAKGSKI